MASASTARADRFGPVRVAARLTLLMATLIVLVPLHYLWRLMRLRSPWPRLFLAGFGRIAGARRRTVGTPLRRDVVFLANHQSWLDIPLLAGASGTAFVAKSELAQVPVVGWLCTLNRTIFVARGERMAIAAQIDALRAALAEAWAVTLFPEGTTGDGRTLLPFKASLLAVLDPPPPGVWLQPVLIDYGTARPDVVWGDEPGETNALRVLGRRGSFVATVWFLDPFDPREFHGRKAIAAEARRRMEEALPPEQAAQRLQNASVPPCAARSAATSAIWSGKPL